METYALVLSYAIPGFILLIIIEELVARSKGVQINRAADTIASLSSGMTNTLKKLLGIAVIILSYDWMVEHWALMSLPNVWWVYVLAFIGLDFKGYWTHRFSHVINIFWNRHIVHHSSEEFNLSCALRQEISALVGVFFFLYIPMAIIGVPAEVVYVVAPLHLFAQFWYHTRLINKMGWLEHVIVTPSHHRVHHAINDEYLDKNFSEVFIVWDKWFGTFQEELPDVPPIYGTKRPAGTWNPVLINYMHLLSMIKDAWRTNSWWDKLRIWFMPTGWRPADVIERYPIQYYKKAAEQVKYDANVSSSLQYWSWAQLVINNVLMLHFMVNIGQLAEQPMTIVLYGGFLFLSIITYTTLMDRHPAALFFEGAKLIFGVGILYQFNGWLATTGWASFTTWMIVFYLVIAFVATVYFLRTEGRQDWSYAALD